MYELSKAVYAAIVVLVIVAWLVVVTFRLSEGLVGAANSDLLVSNSWIFILLGLGIAGYVLKKKPK